jgi:hypothetical protein
MGGKVWSRRRKIALLALSLGHLGLVCAGALHADPGGAGAVGRAAAYYSQLSGADNRYGFFAPKFEMTPLAMFEVNEGDQSTTEVLETEASRDADFRVRLTVGNALFDEDGEWQRAMAASLAGKMFARHPTADSVVLRVLTYALPTMAEYRRGVSPGWDLAYEDTFIPRGKAEAGGGDTKGEER